MHEIKEIKLVPVDGKLTCKVVFDIWDYLWVFDLVPDDEWKFELIIDPDVEREVQEILGYAKSCDVTGGLATDMGYIYRKEFKQLVKLLSVPETE